MVVEVPAESAHPLSLSAPMVRAFQNVRLIAAGRIVGLMDVVPRVERVSPACRVKPRLESAPPPPLGRRPWKEESPGWTEAP